MSKPIVVALAGNPNSGKTTIFNQLTGARQHVGNYPGVTVEKKEGKRRHKEHDIRFVDLPGTYSLTAYSLEELVARDFIIEEKPDVVVDVVDASNLERNLYLASMLIELNVPVILALNMMDVANAQGKSIDVKLLGELFGVQVVPVVASRGEGMDALLDAVLEAVEHGRPRDVRADFGSELDVHIQELAEAVTSAGVMPELPARWVAKKLLENDGQIFKRVAELQEKGEELIKTAASARQHIEEVVGDDAEIAIADRRYGFVSGACREVVSSTQQHRIDWSDKADTILTNRLLGLPIFFIFMWVMFELVFRLGAPPMEWLESLFAWLDGQARASLPPGRLQSLVADGIIGGVGGVLVFLPNILLLFLAISFLEDSGYMARAAFVVDRIMHWVGLHGKSFIAMIIGFGCTVPAVMATRTLESSRDRLITILIVPFMSCGARLPVYILLAGAFFPAAVAGKIIFSLYILGVVVGMLMAKLFRTFVLSGPPTPFVMELPPYRFPTLKGTLLHMWERAWLYVKKAGTIILAMAVVMWFLLSHPLLPEDPAKTNEENRAVAISHSYAGRLGHVIEPVLKPLGFDHKIAVSLIAGFAAKEIIVSTMGTVYSLGDIEDDSPELREALRRDRTFNPLVAYALMVFVLLYIPCMATVAVIRRETNSWGWAMFTVAYTTVVAWVFSFIVYQGGRLLGLG